MRIFQLMDLLFENRGPRQTIFKNATWLAIGEGISRLLLLSLIVYAARLFGPTEFGLFSFAFAFVSIFVIFGDFGLSPIVVREFSQDSEKEKEFSSVFMLKLLLTGGAFVLMWIGSLFITVDSTIRTLILILAVFMLSRDFLKIIFAFWYARQHMQYEALVKILQAGVVVGAGFYILSRTPSAEAFSYALSISMFIVMMFTLVLFRMFIMPSLSFAWDINVWRKLLFLSWPLGLAMAFGVIYIYVDSVMLVFWRDITEVGWYSAAYRIMGVAMIPMALIAMSFYPALSKFFHKSKETLQELWNFQVKIMVTLAVPLVIGGVVVAPKIVNFFYGPDYIPAIFALQILFIVAGLNFLYNPYGMILIVSGQQKKHLWGTGIVAIINIFLNILLIPHFGLYGAGIATLVSYLLLFVLEAEFARRFTSIIIWNKDLTYTFIAALGAGIVMMFVIQQPFVFSLHVLLLVGIAVGVYIISLFFISKLRYILH